MSRAEHRRSCPECGGDLVAGDRERVCGTCGLVASTDLLDRGPEWRPTEEGRAQRRTGAPLTRTRHDWGLSTEIGYASGADLPEGHPRRIARLRREHNRAKIASKAERNRVYGFTEIRRLCGALGLGRALRERACVLFERAQTAGLFQGRSIEGFAAASVYAACRIEGFARTRREVVEVARADRGEFEAAYDAMNRELGLPVAPVDPREYLPRFASDLELGPTVERTAREYATRLVEGGHVVGRKPGGVAGACLYRAANDLGEQISQREVADVVDVSPVTLRNVCKLLEAA
ncbi:MAG: transcription initiation factor IIB [Halobacteriales archaeon]